MSIYGVKYAKNYELLFRYFFLHERSTNESVLSLSLCEQKKNEWQFVEIDRKSCQIALVQNKFKYNVK